LVFPVLTWFSTAIAEQRHDSQYVQDALANSDFSVYSFVPTVAVLPPDAWQPAGG